MKKPSKLLHSADLLMDFVAFSNVSTTSPHSPTFISSMPQPLGICGSCGSGICGILGIGGICGICGWLNCFGLSVFQATSCKL